MATGIDLAASVAGLVSLSVTLFQGCVKGIQLISSARHIGEDAGRVRCMFDWEQHRLVQWGQRLGLGQDSHYQDPQLNWDLIKITLEELESLLSDARVLKERYNLVADEDETAEPLSESRKQGIRVLWRYVKPEIRSTRAQIVHDANSPFKRLRWAAMDHAKLSALHSKVAYFNDCLYKLLGSRERELMHTVLIMLLRDVTSRTPNSQDLDIVRALIIPEAAHEYQSIEATVTLKQLRLRLKLDQSTDEQQALDRRTIIATPRASTRPPHRLGKVSLCKIGVQHISFSPSRADDVNSLRQSGDYRLPKKGIDVGVLVEWKKVPIAVEAQLVHRVRCLTSMLSSIEDHSFHTLRCLGFTFRNGTDGKFNLYGYVFKIPDLSKSDVGQTSKPNVIPLGTIFRHMPGPSLTLRLKMAHDIAEAVLQLHTAGWLHKGLNAHNILFFGRQKSRWDDIENLRPYVAGFEYARADNPLEMTEDAPNDPEFELYRHPEAQGLARSSYKKTYDLYSLGCVLLAIGCWQDLRQLLLDIETNVSPGLYSRIDKPRTAAEGEHQQAEVVRRGKERFLDHGKMQPILERLAFCAGDAMCAAVRLCFQPELIPTEDEDSEASVQTQSSIVEMLSQHQFEHAPHLYR